ncbi:MAG: Ig-like domain-containing protein [Verrucomicrobiota bacterium]
MFRSLLISATLLATLAGFRAMAQPYGLESRPVVGPYLDGVLPPEPPTLATDWTTVVAFPNLAFQNPLGLLPLGETGKLVVWEREGRVWSFDNDAATATKTLVLDLSNQCQGWDDQGLLGLAVHPDFATNHHVYLWYNRVNPGTVIGSPTVRPPNNTTTRQRLARFTYNPATGLLDAASEYVIIDQTDHNTWHGGGGMFFHPDNGFLYLTNGNDNNTAYDQSITKGMFGCVIRIDVDKIGGSVSHAPVRRAFEEVGANWPNAYYVPSDNPFVGVANAVEEIYALGLRSPHRMTIDAVTGRIFIGDVGGGTREEISSIEPNDPVGLNFQWPQIEGYDGDLEQPFIGVSKRPLLDVPHPQANAIIGGYVYRGSAFPELVGKYIFGDNVSNRIWVMDESTHTATTPAGKVLIATMPKGPGPNSGTDYRGLSSFGVDEEGEIYMCQLSSTAGQIYKLQRGSAPSTSLPPTLAETGVFADLATLEPSDKLIPYALNQPFWSDGAVKTRWATVPTGTTIGFNPTGEWTWPAGSVLVKHFELPTDDNNASVRKRLETRLLVKMADGNVYGASYKWRADNSNADLMDGAITENVPIAITPVGSFTGSDLGTPAQAGSVSRVGDELTLTAGGNDIWGTADQGYFASQSRTGDFDISVRVASMTQPDLYAKVGLMARESLAAGSRHVFAMAFPSNAARNNNVGGFEFQYRQTSGGASAAIYPALPQPVVNYPNTWLRMRREGDTFISFSSVDGVWWKEFARLTMNLPQTLFFGVAATSHNGGALATAKVMLQNTRLQPWYFPSRNDCMTCHTSGSGGVLGPKTRQLNGDYHYPSDVTDNQLRSWSHVGLFDNPPPEATIPALTKLAALDDLSAPLETRARSYIDSNCSSCHRPGGVQAFWDARFDTPLSEQGLIYGAVADTLNDPTARVIVPQSLSHSVMFVRDNAIGGGIQMPPLAKNMVDEAGMAVLAEWINSLSTNVAPVVTLTSPAHGSVYLQGDTIALSATASDADGILRVEFYAGPNKIGEDFTAPYQVSWNGAFQGSHTLKAVAVDNIGNNSASAPAVVTVQGAALPPPWQHSDVGTVGFTGDAVYENNGFTLTGSGADVWGNQDGFHFTWRPMTGDGEVIARVASLENTDGWAKAGVMMRETLDSNSRFAFSIVSVGNGASYQHRLATGGGATQSGQVGGINAPYWVRLVRAGTAFTAYRSPDGLTWTQTGTPQTIAMGSTIYAGIAVTAHNNAALCEAVLTNVSFISPAEPSYAVKVNFQPAADPVPSGYFVDGGEVFGARPNGLNYGWNRDSAEDARDRESLNAPDQRYDTFIHLQKAHGDGSTTSFWEIEVPNGSYQVRLVAGDADFFDTQVVTVEGATLINGTTTVANRFLSATGVFRVNDGRLTIAPGVGATNAKVCFAEITSYDVAANIAPTIAVSSPITGSSFHVPSTLEIRAIAGDPDTPVSKVEFLIDGVLTGTSTAAPYLHVWNNPPQGTHVLTARATDAAGAVGISQQVTVLIDIANQAPVISLTSPASGAMALPGDWIALQADANDADGSISDVEFWADGVKLGSDADQPFLWNWSGPHAVGSHSVWAKATDDDGAVTLSGSVTVDVLTFALTPVSVEKLSAPDRVVSTLRMTLPAGRNYVMEWSADLQSWHTLQQGTADGNPIEVIDTAVGETKRFYRTRVAP